jgi:hypothetical protein
LERKVNGCVQNSTLDQLTSENTTEILEATSLLASSHLDLLTNEFSQQWTIFATSS